jgi:hypothetical protein
MTTAWSDPSVIVSILQVIWTVIVTVVAAWIMVYFFNALTPTLKLTVTPRQIPGNEKLIILELELENVSKVDIPKDKVLLKVSPQSPLQTDSANTGDCLAREWVNFTGAHEIFESTTHVNPGERIHVERIYAIQPGDILHVGLQFTSKRPFVRRFFPWPMQWTTTRFIGSVTNSKMAHVS